MLAMVGVDEMTAREHSFEWVADTLSACVDESNARAAVGIHSAFWGFLGAQSKEGHAAMASVVETLTATGGLVEPEPAIADEDDFDRLVAAGAVVDVKVAADV